MSEEDEYYYKDYYPREWAGDEIEERVVGSEALWEVINLAIDERLNDYYHERIVPLERQIRKLGGTPPVEESDEIHFSIRRCNPKDPFKESSQMQEYWLNPESDYYRFFHALIHSLLEHSYIKVVEPLKLSDVVSYWMYVFRCTEQVDLTMEFESKDIVKACEWRGQANLCIYLIDVLRERYFSCGSHNELIQQHFLPHTKSVAQARDSYKNSKTGKPRGYDKIDSILSEILNSLD